MQHRVKRAGADPVAVASQLLDHPVAVQFFFGGVMQDVQADHAGQRSLVLGWVGGQSGTYIDFRNRV